MNCVCVTKSQVTIGIYESFTPLQNHFHNKRPAATLLSAHRRMKKQPTGYLITKGYWTMHASLTVDTENQSSVTQAADCTYLLHSREYIKRDTR